MPLRNAGPDATRDIHTQLAHLKWRKCVNDTRIRTKITSSRALAERDLLIQLSENRAQMRAKWREAVIADELQKPLEVCVAAASERGASRRVRAVDVRPRMRICARALPGG